MRFICISVGLVMLWSCVAKSDYKALEQENKYLKQELYKFEEKQRKEDERKQLTMVHTDDDAIRLVKDYYDFYNSDMKYRKIRVRRSSGNVFSVSLEEASKQSQLYGHEEFFWHSRVLSLVIHEDDRYDIN